MYMKYFIFQKCDKMKKKYLCIVTAMYVGTEVSVAGVGEWRQEELQVKHLIKSY